jgi:hypothetical protein
MDPGTLAAIAQTASNALVTAAVTDTWEDLRHKIARWFGRGQPDQQIERRLDATRDQLMAAVPGELEAAQAALAGQWATRFADLLADYPDAGAELDELINDLKTRVVAAGHSAAAARDMIADADRGGFAANVVHGDVTVGPMSPGQTNG